MFGELKSEIKDKVKLDQKSRDKIDINTLLTIMQNEGDQLRQFIDNQHRTKKSIYTDLGMSKQNLFGLFKSQVLEPETKKKFEDYFNQKIFVDSGQVKVKVSDGKATADSLEKGSLLQVALNLSYAEKRNSNTMEEMAATNRQNSDIIAALIAELLPNSKFARQLAASPDRPHRGGDEPIENFLPPGSDLSKPNQENDKETSNGK